MACHVRQPRQSTIFTPIPELEKVAGNGEAGLSDAERELIIRSQLEPEPAMEEV